MSLFEMTDSLFIEQAEKKLEATHAPILYLHPSENDPPTMVLVTIEEWSRIIDHLPPNEELMNHSHIEG